MKYLCVLLVAILFISSVYAGDELKVAIKDHTQVIFSNSMPSMVNVENYSDFAALALGQSPRYTDSPVPITNEMKRAQASLTIITQDSLNIATQIDLIETNKSQTQSGAVVQAVTGANKCLMGSQSLFQQIYSSNKDSMIFSFSSQKQFAEAMCGSFPTTTPTPGRVQGQAICATLDEFVGETNLEYSSIESNSAIAQAVALSTATDFTLIQSNTGIIVTETAVNINGVEYQRSGDVDNILRELTYMTNVASKLSSFGTLTSDSAVDTFTFVISSASTVENNAELLNLITTVIDTVTTNYATAYKNNLLSAVIISPSTLNASQFCTVGAGGEGLGSSTTTNAFETAVTVEQIRSYQITLWIVLILIAVVISASCATANMHIMPDPAIQGGMSTYWTYKK